MTRKQIILQNCCGIQIPNQSAYNQLNLSKNGSLTNSPKFPSINQLSKDANLASEAKASLHEMGNNILSVNCSFRYKKIILKQPTKATIKL